MTQVNLNSNLDVLQFIKNIISDDQDNSKDLVFTQNGSYLANQELTYLYKLIYNLNLINNKFLELIL